MKVLMLALVLVLVLSSCTSTRFVGTNPFENIRRIRLIMQEIRKKTSRKVN